MPTLTPAEPKGRNRHPADELAELRTEIKALELREGQLRKLIRSLPPNERVGDQYEAVVTSGMRTSLNFPAAKEHFGLELEQFMRVTEVETVKVVRRA